jgi:hypothetical protein
LKVSHLQINSDGHITYDKPVKDISFDFVCVEEFLFACAKENYHLFAQLMKATGLQGHKMANYLREVVKAFINGEVKEVDTHAAIRHIDDAKVVDRGNQLIKQLGKIRKHVEKKILKDNLDEKKQKAVREKINNLLWEQYEASGVASRLPPNFEEDVEKVIKKQTYNLR